MLALLNWGVPPAIIIIIIETKMKEYFIWLCHNAKYGVFFLQRNVIYNIYLTCNCIQFVKGARIQQ